MKKLSRRSGKRIESPYRTKPTAHRNTVGGAVSSAAVQYRTASSMQDDGFSVQQETLNAALTAAELAEVQRKKRQKARYKKQYASPYYEKKRAVSDKHNSGKGAKGGIQTKTKKKKSRPQNAKSILRFLLIFTVSLLLAALLFFAVTLPILLPLTVVGEEEPETTEITEEVSENEQETYEIP